MYYTILCNSIKNMVTATMLFNLISMIEEMSKIKIKTDYLIEETD